MEPLEEGRFYHIYNRGNNKQRVFFETDNFNYFLRLVKKHLPPVAKIYCYCLLPNHFHLLVKIKEGAVNPSQKFSNLFNAYTKGMNKKYDRSGNLFNRTFRRKKVLDELHLKTVIIYIHLNPKYSSLSKNFRDYPFSSYQFFFNSKYTFLERKEVLELFDGIENFQFVHEERKRKLEAETDNPEDLEWGN